MVIICTENGHAKRLKLEKIDGGQESYCRLMFKQVFVAFCTYHGGLIYSWSCVQLPQFGALFRLTAVKLTVEGCFIFKLGISGVCRLQNLSQHMEFIVSLDASAWGCCSTSVVQSLNLLT